MANITNQPMYQKIKEDILLQIKTNLLSPGDKLPTEHQLMKQYQVSRITVNRALSELKNEGVVERFTNKGSFVAQPQKMLSRTNDLKVPTEGRQRFQRLPEIACIIPTLTDNFSLSMINGVLSAFPENEYICHFFQSQNPQIENYLLKYCLETNISGIVLFPQNQPFFSDELLFMSLQKYPLVLLDRFLPRLNTSYVISDNRMAGELCARHLNGLGHRRIALVTTSNRNTFSVKLRFEGLCSAAGKLNMPENSVRIVEGFDITKKFDCYQEKLIRLVNEEKITAFVATESDTCDYLYNLCTSLKIDVPKAVSLISFDTPMTTAQNPDFFTHINQSEFNMGREAGNILRRCLEQHDMNVYHKVITPSLEVRQSTASAVF